jgi:hypothetical protein
LRHVRPSFYWVHSEMQLTGPNVRHTDAVCRCPLRAEVTITSALNGTVQSNAVAVIRVRNGKTLDRTHLAGRRSP